MPCITFFGVVELRTAGENNKLETSHELKAYRTASKLALSHTLRPWLGLHAVAPARSAKVDMGHRSHCREPGRSAKVPGSQNLGDLARLQAECVEGNQRPSLMSHFP